jgi:hypothetical protein
MAIRNTNLGGTANFLSGEVLEDFDLDDTFYYNSEVYSVSGTTTETDMSSVTLTSGELGDSGTIRVTMDVNQDTGANTIWKLYVNGSEEFAWPNDSGDGKRTLHYIVTGVDTSSGNIIVKNTATRSGTTNGCSSMWMDAVGYRR